MKYLGIIIGVVLVAVLGLWAVFTFAVKPKAGAATTVAQATPPAPAAPKAASGDRTADRMTALGSLLVSGATAYATARS